METDIGSGGDFAYAYVIAHEVGHHVQNLLGILPEAHSQMSKVSKTEANRISVRIELQADYLAGVWGNIDNKMFNSLEPGDVEEAVNVASRASVTTTSRKSLRPGDARRLQPRTIRNGASAGSPKVCGTATPPAATLSPSPTPPSDSNFKTSYENNEGCLILATEDDNGISSI